MFGSDLVTEWGVWAVGIKKDAFVDGGPHNEMTVFGDQTYKSTTTISK